MKNYQVNFIHIEGHTTSIAIKADSEDEAYNLIRTTAICQDVLTIESIPEAPEYNSNDYVF